ncbi:MAG: CehA/McbA family metallohydrolase, partial [Acidobacteriota bacterium]|nr:CehA/McbA family metallohydrolase [Acidobacteriota bacterium]
LSYQYDKKNGANVLDLGVFDSRFDESEQTLRGFRGWSGGRRSAIFITENSATNGYVAGKIPAGTWRVAFGLYKVAPEGTEVTVKVKFGDVDAELLNEQNAEESKSFTLPALKKLPAPQIFGGYKWFRGDLHLHTFHSDGTWTIPLILDWANAGGLDFVGITEHNTFSHHAKIDAITKNYKNLLVLRGEEVTTYGGHFNVWGLPSGKIVDFRVRAKNSPRIKELIADTRKLGAIASINHPFAPCGGCDWSYGDWRNLDSVEIWNGAWNLSNETALKKWDEFLQNGQKITAIGSSDSHTPPLGEKPPPNALAIGTPTNHVGMKNLTQIDLFEAIRGGRVWIGNAANDYNLEFSALNGAKQINIGETTIVSGKKIRFDIKTENFPANSIVSIISNGQILFSEPIKQAESSFAKKIEIKKDSYFRLEIRNADKKMLGLTNPIYVQVKR